VPVLTADIQRCRISKRVHFGSVIQLSTHDVIIIGAGPAGLAAANACYDRGINAILFDCGNDSTERDRHIPADIGQGVGGAGLFSDGKFSFYPSATQLWDLQPAAHLKLAYTWVSGVLQKFGIDAPELPTGTNSSPRIPSEHFETKTYTSAKMDLDRRSDLVSTLASTANLRPCSTITNISVRAGEVVANVLESVDGRLSSHDVTARAAIIATGRLGAIPLLRWLPVSPQFRRVEFGIRLEQSAETFFLRNASTLDPKLIAHESPGIEWRTFCCCRNGEVVDVSSTGICAVAGRSDGEPSGRSNIAFHVRITDPALGAKFGMPCVERLEKEAQSFRCSLDDASDLYRTDFLEREFGVDVASYLRHGLEKLCVEQAVTGPVDVYGPSLEGVGFYPPIESDLRIPGYPIWLPGDVAGLFRGLTAALVSGYFVGLQSAEYICG
jgi:uncharacterized protein